MAAEQYSLVKVKMWGKEVGIGLWHSTGQYASFEFEEPFLAAGLDVAPLHMSIQAAREENYFEFPNLDKTTFLGLPGLLANSLPDNFGNAIINAWLRRQGRSPNTLNPVERLTYIGSRGMGALEFEPCIADKHLHTTTRMEIDKLQELVQDALAVQQRVDVEIGGNERQINEAMYDILKVGTSAGGAVPKAIIAMNNEGHVLSGQAEVPDDYTHYILKFDGMGSYVGRSQSELSASTRVEYAYSLMAKHAGMKMMDCLLLEAEGKAHFLTKRFDRIGNRRIHTLNLAGIAHYGWNPAAGVGYEDVFRVMRMLNLTYGEKQEQFRRMVFNVFAKNVDDHVKNISFAMDEKGEWHLAPAYDVQYTYDPHGLLESRHKLTVDSMQRDISLANLMNAAKQAEVKNPHEIIVEVADAVTRWPEFARQAGVAKTLIAEIGHHHEVERILSR